MSTADKLTADPPSPGPERKSDPVPPDPIDLLINFLNICEILGSPPAADIRTARRALDQIYQAGASSPRGLSVEEILDHAHARARGLIGRCGSLPSPAQGAGEVEIARHEISSRAAELGELLDWAKKRMKPEPGVTGPPAGGNGEAVAALRR